MLVHFPNSTVEVGESRGLTGLDRNTFQSKLKLFVFWLLPKNQNLCFLLKLGIHKKVKQKNDALCTCIIQWFLNLSNNIISCKTPELLLIIYYVSSEYAQFLDAFLYLYKRVCPSVRPSATKELKS